MPSIGKIIINYKGHKPLFLMGFICYNLLMTKQKQKIIIDTDPGHDDALAIILLEKSSFFDIKAITTVAGNSTIQKTTNNARYILNLIESKTSLYSGAGKPLKKDLVLAEVHGQSGLEGANITKQEKLTNNAAEKIIQIVDDNPNEITITAIGPLTNIAQAFTLRPDLPALISRIVIMGGAITAPGNKNRVGEFNMFVDPDAADIVFQSQVDKVLVPLDVCNNVFLTLEEFDQLKPTNLYEPITKMMEHYINGLYKFEKTVGALMYDPLAAYFLINPTAFKLESMDIKIETESELTRGMTVADRRLWGEKKFNTSVATDVNREIFIKDFLRILSS